MAINTLADWTANGALSRQSILGRPRRKDGRELPGEDGDEVLRSRTTDHHIQTFFDALEGGDESGQSHALNKVVQSWRADNNAGGLPVFAHLPLPSAFANTMAKAMRNATNASGSSAAKTLTAKLESGARFMVMQQLQEVAKEQEREPISNSGLPHVGIGLAEGRRSPHGQTDNPRLTSVASLHPKPLFDFGEDSDNAGSPFAIAQAQSFRPSQQPYSPPGTPAGQSQQSQRQRKGVAQAPQSWWRQQEILPPEDGGEEGLRPSPSPNGPFATPKKDKQPALGYEYGEWEKKPDPRTSTGTLLVSPSRLTQRQRDNLLDRNWVSPTGKPSGAGRLEEGYGYFGADRPGPGNTTVHHGAYDAPYKYPLDPDYDPQGKPIKYVRTVRLPTRATYLGFVPQVQNDPVYGKRTINMFRFSLGDGIILEMLHVEPSPAFLTRLAAAQRAGTPLEFDAGELLGEIDGDHDHTHLQIRVSGPNGEKWVVDPTLFVEKRARTFLRTPMPDFIDDAIDWGVRQLE